VTVTLDRYGAELARRAGEDLAKLCGGDLYLAIACADGDAAAIACLDRELLCDVEHVARRLRATPDQAAEARSQLSRVLLVDEPGRAAGLRDYAGRGNLRAYIRVIVTRDLIKMIQRGRRETPDLDEEILARLGTQHDPEISMLRAQYHGVVNDALRDAIAKLDDRTRALLRYQIVDGWTVDQVAEVYGVHRATAARWMVVARATLAEVIRAELAARLEIDADEVASIIRLVQSRVDVSLDRLLGTG
jgi:RNA polymerase sigma-70 factor (ECF subfamily)